MMHSPAATAPAPGASRAGTATGPILVAARGDRDEAAMRAARRLAERTGAAVRVLSVLEPEINFRLPLGFSLPLEYERDRSALRLHAVERGMMTVLGDDAPLWPTDVVVGDPARVVAHAASATQARLVVMGMGAHDPLRRILGGETPLATIRRAPVPVLVVAHDAPEAPRTVVAGVDFGVAGIHALEVLLELLEPPAVVHLVHTWPAADTLHPLLRDRMRDYERMLPGRFERLVEALRVPDGISVHAEWLPGRPAEEIREIALARRAELVVVGRGNRRGVERFLVGSTSAAVLRGATCSVLVVPGPSAREGERIERETWGTSEGRSPERWAAQLEAFTARNGGRRAILEVDDPVIGAQAQATGYVLRGVEWDQRDGRVLLMLGAPGGTSHLTRSIGDVRSIAVLAEEDGETLRILYDGGQVLLQIVTGA